MDLPEFNKVTIWDPETEKEYICDNEFDFKIRQFMELKQCVDFDDEVVELAFSLRDELINDLDNNNSVSDSIKCKYIKYIEKNYLMYILDFHIQQNILVDSTSKLNEFQPFQYKPKSQKSEVTKKHKGKGGRPPDPGRAKTIRQLQNNPQGSSSGSSRVIRGCGWDYYGTRYVNYCRVADRYRGNPDSGSNNGGFRLVLSQD